MRAGRNKKARGRKISGIEPMPGEDKVTGLFKSSFFIYLLTAISSYYVECTVDVSLKSSCLSCFVLGSDHVK